jgi:hypothetical protein
MEAPMPRIGIAALVTLLFANGASGDSAEQLLEIMALHEKLATEEAFQQQAKLLGAYVEAAQSMTEEQRTLVYQRVIGILRQIEKAVEPPAPPPGPPSPPPAGHTPGGSLDAGAARIEWFKAESLDAIPEVPARKALWTRDLLAKGDAEDKDLPRAPASPVARITFFFHVKTPGDHAFSAQHGENDLRIVVAKKPVLDLPKDGPSTGEGVVYLERGFHRIDVLLKYEEAGDPSFAVKVLAPGAAESRVLAKPDLLLTRPAAVP